MNKDISQKPTLTIITVNLNNASGLRKTIKSIAEQTFTNYEFIIIDGGSNDESMNIINQYKNKINYWISEPDKGIYNAMNKGILKARGKYIQFLNSGDWLVSIDTLKNIFSEPTMADLIYGNMITINSKGKKKTNYGTSGQEITFLTFYLGTITHSAAFIRKSLFDKYGLYDENLKIVSDWKFYLLAFGLKKKKIVYKNIEVSNFDTTGISYTNKKLANDERIDVLKEIIPEQILSDYNNYGDELKEIQMIRRYWLSRTIYRSVTILFVLGIRILDKIFKN
jgi:glycosyltransferase involved in cell wall biosynthesis